MSLAPYRRVLALPGVSRLLLFSVLARVPQTASGVVLTLHVVTTLHLGYGAAGLVATVLTVGMGVGGPWRGRAIDRFGLRRALAPSVVATTLAWGLSPFAGYEQLLVLAGVGGLLGLPLFSVTRQSLSVLVPGEQRRTAFSLDGIGTEISFMIGPTAGVLLATQLSTAAALLTVAVASLAAGIALILLDPPTRSVATAGAAAGVPATGGVATGGAADGGAAACGAADGGAADGGAGRGGRFARPVWFGAGFLAVLGVAAGGTVVLAGTDVAVVAHLREHDAVPLTGLVFTAWGLGSMLGGLVYGAVNRSLSPFWMLFGLAVLTIPVGLAPGPYLLLLTILPAAALCSPVIAATAEGVSRLVPEEARGEAMGWHGSALQAGSALGAPLAGVAMDAAGAWSGFAVVGLAGALLAAAGLLAARRQRGNAARPTPTAPRLPDVADVTSPT